MLSLWQVQEIIEQSGIDNWGSGYFSIDRKGNVVSKPKGKNGPNISIPHIIEKAKEKGLTMPMIIRFPQIIKEQISRMYHSFQIASKEYNYQGKYLGVFPFKVNQRKEFIDAIVSCGFDLNWGLEVGSKTEFMAALSYPLNKNALFICNGFKDHEFVSMAFLAASMGRKVALVVEGPDELELVINKLKKDRYKNSSISIGLRVRLYSKGSGKWEKSSGETSKFGLTTVEVIEALNLLEQAGLQDKLEMLHFHIGSQITAIKRFKNALREAARVYAKIIKMNFNPSYLNIGGGVGVDYDGSQTSGQSSANYSLQEFANDAVYVIGEICKKEQVPEPNIVTESGRVIAAHHAIVVTDIREAQGAESLAVEKDLLLDTYSDSSNTHKYIRELRYVLDNMSSKNFSEYYHDAVEYHEDLFTLFNLGYLNLKERALTEHLFNKICVKALHFASSQRAQSDEFENLQKIKVTKYLANFSIFQSIPDAWSIGQLFPVLPLSRHDEKASHKATIVDITCDSDGCIDRFIDSKTEKSTLDLHEPNGEPYYLGFFLVGAYQESLANEHNLFGAINEVEVVAEPHSKGQWAISKITNGDSIKELLVCRNYSVEEMSKSYKDQLDFLKDSLSKNEKNYIYTKLMSYLDNYPYLKEKKD